MGRVRENYDEVNISEFELFENMYTIEDEYKFSSINEAKRICENLRGAVKRMRKRTNNQALVKVYISVLDIKNSVGEYQYTTTKRLGGKRIFIGPLKTSALPHWHIVIIGEGACAMCNFVISYLQKRFLGYQFRKKHLREWEDKERFVKYAKRQAIYCRTF